MNKYKEYKKLDFPAFEEAVLANWKKHKVFEESVNAREGAPSYVFYEGPPSANGMPGIHHVMARAVKDIFCRYNTLKGFQVKRKAGWDTHGLPVELQVEKTLGITKEDIGKKISVAEYNEACKKDVMKYTDIWDKLTDRMGYWVDLSDPYITYETNYIESLWNILKKLYDKGYLYKGYTIQPYSPAAGTGLSSHELNQPGTYKDVKDNTLVAQFECENPAFFGVENEKVYFLAWTTTPWTLPSNTALAVGEKIDYVLVQTYNPYTFLPVHVVLAKDLCGKYFPEANAGLELSEYKAGDKKIPFKVLKEYKGKELCGLRYQQLLPFAQPDNGDAFRVIGGDFVTTSDGTGIVHIAPSFGADDFRVAKQNGIGSLTLVDKRGKFVDEVNDAIFPLNGRFVKEAYLNEEEKAIELSIQQERLAGIIPKLEKYLSVDELIALKLKIENKAFKIEKYEHTYPHCWRTDKPILYYPLESWFIKTTAVKERLVELNKTINWKPEHTGTGRFGNWLENLVDWNLSRSRYWGTPLPIWRTEDGSEEKCIGSIQELENEIAQSVEAGFMAAGFDIKDLHKPYVDQVVLVSSKGEKMHREADLIDVWFDSGAMPYAQWHWPFENEEVFKNNFPADFIAEGVDQTRGWFFTLHALSVLLFDSISYKNVIANGLVLDKFGNKMSKRLGNVVDPFKTIDQFGADATRWYLLSNSDPWDNLKFDLEGVAECQRKFFGTLYNTYNFFALYANLDNFSYAEEEIPLAERPEIDQWIISLLNTLVLKVEKQMNNYDPTPAARAIQEFVGENLSNWYVRLCRRRFWKGEYSKDKMAAYQTLYTCLETIAQLMSPFAPFYSDQLFQDLNTVANRHSAKSVHLSDFPKANLAYINSKLEKQMEYAQTISSLVLSIRKKENIKVRQPLQSILIPVIDPRVKNEIELVKELILAEVNVKELKFIEAIDKAIKPNFKSLGKKVGSKMKAVAEKITAFTQNEIVALENAGNLQIEVEGSMIEVHLSDVEIVSKEIAGYKVANEGALTVALDIHLSDRLVEEGIARELISKIQNLRKERGFDLLDKIDLKIIEVPYIKSAINQFKTYICSEILANDIQLVTTLSEETELVIDEISIKVHIEKFN
ncbi:MAG: isoleucine--tRNA ligase [Sphingobacteriales bacterium]|nr:isoleucine--tRNA ligase [Sphingobacteriales bacterium]